MIEIAGGILIAVLVIACLPWIIAGAYWAVVVGVGLALIVGLWFGLAGIVGEGWTWAIFGCAVLAWLFWTSDHRVSEKPENE